MSELTPEQQKAVECSSKYVRLLAGPGTGKTRTLQYRVKYLIDNIGVQPEDILILTFTRAATYELRQRIKVILTGKETTPNVATLHSFALKQILYNSKIIEKLPKPLRIADDWEERNIIQEDLKSVLKDSIKEIQRKFSFLSADWQTLNADEADWEKKFPDPAFIGAWRSHRNVLGYSLRSELVYQFKRVLNETSDFKLDKMYKHVLVDEYQDLNRCDLAVIKTLVEKLDASLFIAGDDDQSIYGFRFAQPEGIRHFPEDYSPSENLGLTYCMRYGEEIMKISEFIADLDPHRLKKGIKIPEGAKKGNVELLRFPTQIEESGAIAKICDSLIKGGQFKPDEILILLRSDFNKVMSGPIKEKLEALEISVNINIEAETPLETKEGRLLLSHLRLVLDKEDRLAWRTVMQLRDNGIGQVTLSKILKHCEEKNMSFATCLLKIDEEMPGGSLGKSLKAEVDENFKIISLLETEFKDVKDSNILINKIKEIIKLYPLKIDEVVAYLQIICAETESGTLTDLIRNLSSAEEDIEQEIEKGKINIMTMHKAKGLTAGVVIIVGAEDQIIPGKHDGEGIGDERRLLFVSLSRAREFLFITYCEKRIGAQAFTGRQDTTPHRELTQFLQDAPITPKSGTIYIKERGL